MGPSTGPPLATRPLLVGAVRQSKRGSPFTGQCRLCPAAEAGAAASRRKGSGGQACERHRGRGEGRGSEGAGRVAEARPRCSPMRCPTGELKGFPSRKSIAAAPRSADAAASSHVTRAPGWGGPHSGFAVTPPAAAAREGRPIWPAPAPAWG